MARNRRGTLLYRQERTVKGVLRELHLVIKPYLVRRMSHDHSKSLHHLTHLIVVSRRDERHIGLAGRVLAMNQFFLLGWHAPVAILSTIDDTVALILRLQMFQPTLNVRIELAKRLVVTIVSPQHL